MAHNIAVSEEVYQILKRSKLPGESFSMVIKRNLQRGKLTDIAGTAILSQEDWAATKKMLAEADELAMKKLSGKS